MCRRVVQGIVHRAAMMRMWEYLQLTMGLVRVYETEFVFRSLMAWGKKLLLSLSVFAIMLLKRLPDGSKQKRWLPGWVESLRILAALLSALLLVHHTIIKLRWALFVTYTIIQSITSSEMCSLHLTHQSVHTHLEQWAADTAAPKDQLGVQCLAQGSHLSRGQFLPEPRFDPTISGYTTLYPLEPWLPGSRLLLPWSRHNEVAFILLAVIHVIGRDSRWSRLGSVLYIVSI